MSNISAVARRMTETLFAATDQEVIGHLAVTNAQWPHPSEVPGLGPWKKGKVALKNIQLSPSPTLRFMAGDPDAILKANKVFPQSSIHTANDYLALGGDFPAVILLASGNDYHGRYYDIGDGYHRVLAAMMAGDKAIDAYITA